MLSQLKKIMFNLVSLTLLFSVNSAISQSDSTKNVLVSTETQTPPNIILIISDQENYRLAFPADYQLPARQTLKRRGVTFANHYTAAAMSASSQATFLTGVPPQINGIFDQMEYNTVPPLDPKRPNMGSVLKKLGYRTAYFGKFELGPKLLAVHPDTQLMAYGFDVFNPNGVEAALRWLHQNALDSSKSAQPFFMLVQLSSGAPLVQKAETRITSSASAQTLYAKQWHVALPTTFKAPLVAPGMPSALSEYQHGWTGAVGSSPMNKKDMWHFYYNNYLNALLDADRRLQLMVTTIDEMDLWSNTVIIATANHGEMGGAHGGLRGNGPMAYEENSHIPLIIHHPRAPEGVTCAALTSHLDLLPTLVGLTGLPDTERSGVIKGLSGYDFSQLLEMPQKKAIHAIRSAILFNYLGLSTIDANYLQKTQVSLSTHKPLPAITEVDLSKRGLLAFIFDGRYKFARYYAPNAFNTPKTLEQIFVYNDVQLFDLQNDPHETLNLALDPDENKDLILRMNKLLNDLITQEVGLNDGKFLPKQVRPETLPLTFNTL